VAGLTAMSSKSTPLSLSAHWYFDPGGPGAADILSTLPVGGRAIDSGGFSCGDAVEVLQPRRTSS